MWLCGAAVKFTTKARNKRKTAETCPSLTDIVFVDMDLTICVFKHEEVRKQNVRKHTRRKNVLKEKLKCQ